MIIRIVKMTFHSNKINDFLKIYKEVNPKIKNFKGCNHLELLNDITHSNIFFTYSHWDTEQDLLNYKNSALFTSTWSGIKAFFEQRAEAWSVTIYEKQNDTKSATYLENAYKI